MRTLLVGIALAACGSDSTAPTTAPAPAAAGPAYTPGIHLELTNFAPECTITKDDTGKAYACVGRFGTVAIALGTNDRLRRIEIKLRPMMFPVAKAHLDPALRPILGQAAVDTLDARLEKLQRERATLELSGARIGIAAATPGDPEVHEYTITLDW